MVLLDLFVLSLLVTVAHNLYTRDVVYRDRGTRLVFTGVAIAVEANVDAGSYRLSKLESLENCS